MMQPTPAPSSAPNSPRPEPESGEDPFPPAPQNTDAKIPFRILSQLFMRLQGERRMATKNMIIRKWFDHWREAKGADLYPVLRLILPHKDRERAVYGLKEKTLAKSYIDIIPLGKKDPDAIRLENWKKPTEREKASGDFPTVLYEVVGKRSSVLEGSLSIDELNDALDELAKNMGKKDIQNKTLKHIYMNTTPEEQKWIARIILKDMIISVKETTVFSVFHKDAQDLYNTCSDLKRVAWTLSDPDFSLKADDKAVRLFHAFAPMLCKRPTKTIDLTVKALNTPEFIIEEKLDGERIQLHKRGNEYFYCSRAKTTPIFMESTAGTGSLTPWLAKAFDERVTDIILDGEMLVWDPVSERNLPFGTLKSAALDPKKGEHNPRPCFKIFDLLYLNGMSLLDKSVTFRKRNMRAWRVEFVTEFKGSTAQDISDKMEKVMENRGEGLVIKHPHAKYVLNGRNSDWYKDNCGETVDVLVIAGEYGSGSRGGGVSAVICAVVDDRGHNDDDEDIAYSTFVRVGSGLSYADLTWIRKRTWHKWDPKKLPSDLRIAQTGQEDKGDVYLEPSAVSIFSRRFILKVKAAEIVPTVKYHLGHTLRFPRALVIRDELEISDCMTANDVMESLRAEKKRKLETDVSGPKNKKKRKVIKYEILPEYKGPNLEKVQVKTDLFAGITFCVKSNTRTKTWQADRETLMILVKENGGKNLAEIPKTLNPSLSSDLKTRVIDQDNYDIILPAWIHDSVSQGKRVPLSKRYLFHATSFRKDQPDYDEGEDVTMADPNDDTMTEDEDEDEEAKPVIKASVAGPDDGAKSDTDDDSDNEDTINDDQGGPPDSEDEGPMAYDEELIFKHLSFYLDSPSNARKHEMKFKPKVEEAVEASFGLLAKTIEENGGRIVDLDDPELTHIIIDKRDDGRRVALIKRTFQPKYRCLILSEYIEACLEEKTLLDENDFAP
ncbi:DNA ligase 4 [Mycena floridula]|nr:DNA ligase 4 [Mycena floridula]